MGDRQGPGQEQGTVNSMRAGIQALDTCSNPVQQAVYPHGWSRSHRACLVHCEHASVPVHAAAHAAQLGADAAAVLVNPLEHLRQELLAPWSNTQPTDNRTAEPGPAEKTLPITGVWVSSVNPAISTGKWLQTCAVYPLAISVCSISPAVHYNAVPAGQGICSSGPAKSYCPPTQVMACDAHLLLQLLLHHTLCGNASMVSARHPQHVVAAHATPAHNSVLQQPQCSTQHASSCVRVHGCKHHRLCSVFRQRDKPNVTQACAQSPSSLLFSPCLDPCSTSLKMELHELR